jgi:Spy/CpxP family protein refolding chaperone
MLHSSSRSARRLLPVALAVLAGAFAVVVLAPQLSAQAPAGGGGRKGGGGGQMMTALFQGITLTDVQQKSVDSVKAVYQPQMEQLRGQGPASRSQMRDLRQRQIADFRSILTSEQQSAFDKNVDAMRARMTGKDGGGGGGAPPQ